MKDPKIEKLKAQIDIWSAEIDRMEADLKAAGSDARLKYQEKIEALKTRRDEAIEKYEEFIEASGESVDSVRQGVVAAWNELAQGVQAAKHAFKGLM